MFCHKCGTQIIEDSAFCPKCGEMLIKDKTTQRASKEPGSSTDLLLFFSAIGNFIRAALPALLSVATIVGFLNGGLLGAIKAFIAGMLVIFVVEAIAEITSKIKQTKKSVRKLIVAAVVILTAVIFVQFVSSVDYIETVKAYRPFTNWGYNQTYQDVLSNFIDDLNWSYEEVGDGAEVTARGISPLYGNTEIVISVIPIPGEDNLCTIDPISVSVGSEKSIGPLVQFDLLGMFGAYAQGSDVWFDQALAATEEGANLTESDEGGYGMGIKEAMEDAADEALLEGVYG